MGLIKRAINYHVKTYPAITIWKLFSDHLVLKPFILCKILRNVLLAQQQKATQVPFIGITKHKVCKIKQSGTDMAASQV